MKSILAAFVMLGIAFVAGCAADRVERRPLLASTEPLLVDADLVRPRLDRGLVISALPAAQEVPVPTVLSAGLAAAGPTPPETGSQVTNVIQGSVAAPLAPIAPAGQMAALVARPIQGAGQTPGKVPARPVVNTVLAEALPQEAKPSPVAIKAEPTLDVAALKERLRNTNTIGLFTKIALKNQVDDLLALFRSYHGGDRKGGLGALREPYNTLVGKVLSLVGEGDPPLARTISGSREAIWSILADPEKFKSVT